MARRQLGFSLVEVMVAFFVIAVGLIGIAKMQSLAIANTGIASMRSLAAIEAASLASAMHANKAYWAANLAPNTFTVSGGSSTTDPKISDATLSGQSSDCSSSLTICQTAAGLAVRMAAYDVKQWGRALAPLLPNYVGIVSCPSAVPVICTIQLTWSEKAISMNAATAGGPAMAAPTFTLTVEP